MTVKDLRTLLDNLDEYIHVPGGIVRLKKTILHLAVSGQLVPQDQSEGTGEELYQQIQAEKQKLAGDGKLKKQKPLPEITEEEIPFDIPKSWKWVRLGEVGEFGSGSTPPRGEGKYYDGDINWFKSGELTDSYMTSASEESIKELALKECSLRLNKPGDILIAMYGATAGKLGLLEIEGTTNQAVCGFTLHHGLNRIFTFNYMLSTRDKLIERSSGAAQPNISKVKIINHQFALPPLAEQERITQKVDLVFKLIDKLVEKYKVEQVERSKLVKSSLSKLAKEQDRLGLDILTDIIKTKKDAAELRKTILQLAVSGQLVPQDPSEGTGEELHQQIQEEKQKRFNEGNLKKQKTLPDLTAGEIPFDIPKSWKWVRLGEVGATSTGKTPSTKKHSLTDGAIPFIGPGDITKANELKAEFPKNISNDASESSEYAKMGDLLMVCIGGSIGKAALVNKDLCFNQQINKITPVRFNSRFLFDVLVSGYFNRLIVGSAVGGATPIINQTRWSKLPVPIPPTDEQERIVEKTTDLLELITKLERQLGN